MTLWQGESFELSSLVAAAYQSTTAQRYFEFSDDTEKWATHFKCGLRSNNGNLVFALEQAVAPSASASQYWTLETHTFGASSQEIVKYAPASAPALLPYGRLSVRVESTGNAPTTFNNIVARFLEGK